MEEAIRLAGLNLESGHGGPFGCVVVKNGKIIASAYNEVLVTNDPTAHAEILAIRRACEALNSHQLEDCDIYTSCEPCPMCLAAIYWARLDKLWFAATRADATDAGFDDEHIYSEISKGWKTRQLPAEQIMQTEAKKSFEAWEQHEDRINY